VFYNGAEPLSKENILCPCLLGESNDKWSFETSTRRREMAMTSKKGNKISLRAFVDCLSSLQRSQSLGGCRKGLYMIYLLKALRNHDALTMFFDKLTKQAPAPPPQPAMSLD